MSNRTLISCCATFVLAVMIYVTAMFSDADRTQTIDANGGKIHVTRIGLMHSPCYVVEFERNDADENQRFRVNFVCSQ